MGLKKYKEKLILLGGTIGIGAVSLAITLTVYNVQLTNTKEINKEKQNDEIKNEEIVFNVELTEAQKVVAQNLIAELKELEKTSNDNKVENEIQDDEKNVIETTAKAKKEISFVKPVDGEFGMVFADEKLVYSKTLEEWLTHKAVDFLAPVDSLVKASAEGKVTEIFNDKKYGFTIIIEHSDGYVSKYSGIKEGVLVNVGDKVEQGDGIAQIAMPSGFEIGEGSHLHFELLKDGVNVEPNFI